MGCRQAVAKNAALVSGLPGDVLNIMLMMLACVCGIQRCKQSDADDVGFGPGVFEDESKLMPMMSPWLFGFSKMKTSWC